MVVLSVSRIVVGVHVDAFNVLLLRQFLFYQTTCLEI